MAVNNLSPAYSRIYYVHNGIEHVKTIPHSDVADNGDGTWNAEMKNGTFVTWTSGIDDIVANITPLMTAECTITHAELWTQPLPTDDPLNVQYHPIATVGAVPAPRDEYTTATWTYRTTGGGILRDVWFGAALTAPLYQRLLDPAGIPTGYDVPPSYMVGATCIYAARDNTFAILPLNLIFKQNDTSIGRARRLGEI